jgi:hypothetical protein
VLTVQSVNGFVFGMVYVVGIVMRPPARVRRLTVAARFRHC